MGNANIFRRLKERYDRGNMSSIPSLPSPSSYTPSYASSPSASPSSITTTIAPYNPSLTVSTADLTDDGDGGGDGWMIMDRMETTTAISSTMNLSSPAHNGRISPSLLSPSASPSSSTSSIAVAVAAASTPSRSPSSSPASSQPPTPTASSSSVTSSPSASLSSIATPTKRVSRFSRATAAIKNKINSVKNKTSGGSTPNTRAPPLPPWIPTTPELILDEKGLHEVFDRFDHDRKGVLCMKKMKLLVLELLEYCVAVEKVLLKQAQSRGDSMSVELAHDSLVRLQLIHGTPRLVEQWCQDLHGACDGNRDGRVCRTDFIASFNRHLQLY